MSVIDTATNTVVATIPVAGQPVGITITPDGSEVYVATELNNMVAVINTATNTVDATIPVGDHPNDIAFPTPGTPTSTTTTVPPTSSTTSPSTVPPSTTSTTVPPSTTSTSTTSTTVPPTPPPGSCDHFGDHIHGNFVVHAFESCILDNTVVDGNVVVEPNGSLVIENHSFIGVNVSVNHGHLTLLDSTVGNDVSLIQPIPTAGRVGLLDGDNFAAEICASTISNNLSIERTPPGNDGVVVGATDLGTAGGCGQAAFANPGNTIGNNLSVFSNMSPVFIANNDIGHNVACVGNAPPPVYDSTNHANGEVVGQCAAP